MVAWRVHVQDDRGDAFCVAFQNARDAVIAALEIQDALERESFDLPRPIHVRIGIIMRWLGWINTHLPLIVPSFLGSAFGTFLLRQFFLTMPRELEDAATIDGAGRFTMFGLIFLPLAKPALSALGIFSFMAEWNNLLDPVIYLSDRAKMTLTVGLASLRGEYFTDWGLLMAGALLSVLPILAIYVAAQKYFIRGITMSGIKG